MLRAVTTAGFCGNGEKKMGIEDVFGYNLRQMIKDRGYKNIRRFCEQNDLDYRQTWAYATGKHLPGLITTFRLTQILGCKVDDLLRGATR